VPLIPIDTPEDPRVAEYREITDAELMRRRGLFVAEGRTVVARMIEGGRFQIRSLLLNPASHRALAPVLSELEPEIPVFVCASRAFAALTGFDFHRGCLALAGRPPARGVEEIAPAARLLVVLEGVTNADNVGSVFRNAAAFGADAVLLSPTCCDPLYRKAIRTSMAASLRVPFARLEPWPQGLERLTASGISIVALTPGPDAETLEHFVAGGRPARLALLVGTEGSGLTAGAATQAAARVRIPIGPAVDSLNLAVATGIALSRLCD
jgi:tRNA G18 (ribose-2'-O)-methylase SpoU